MNTFVNKAGFDDFIWWIGVVENREDPLKMGRCQVRIFGIHSDNLSHIKKKNLPWAQPMLGINGSLLSGTPQEGDYVFGFFFDGRSCQLPCVMGVFPGIPQKLTKDPKNWGFLDPRTDKELEKAPRKPVWTETSWKKGTPARNPILPEEPTTSRISRNYKINETFVGYKLKNLKKDVKAVDATWSEPASKYAPVSPYNRVFESESGHLLEFDDTPGVERIHLAHRTGTFFEIFPDGSQVTKIVGPNYTISANGNNISITGTSNRTVTGTENTEISEDCNITVKGTCNILVTGDVNLTTEANVNANAVAFNLTGDVNITGQVAVTGGITTTEDVVAAGISLDNHLHTGVTPGASLTGTPV